LIRLDDTVKTKKDIKELQEINRFLKLNKKIKDRYPKFNIRYKDKTKVWKILPKLLKEKAITFNNTIWLPSEESKSFITLAHEYQHVIDQHRMGFWKFVFIYLSPQALLFCLFLFALISFCVISWSFNTTIVILTLLLSIMSFLPWPARTRVNLEMKAILLSLYIAKVTFKEEDSIKFRKKVIDSMSGWLYYKMIWDPNEAEKLVSEALEQLENIEDIPNIGIAFKDVYGILNDKEQTIV
jgi:hypothetical protein